MRRPDVYISGDVEADGPIPGPYSMLSFGLAVAGRYDGTAFEPLEPAAHTFYAELQPISDIYIPEALEVSGLDRDVLLRDGRAPAEAMEAAARWVQEVTTGGKAVFVGYPVVFDWLFLYWYFVRFAPSGSPFGHSSVLDVKTLYAVRAGAPISRATKRHMPRHLRSRRPHTHNALDDAIEQAELFANIFRWTGP